MFPRICAIFALALTALLLAGCGPQVLQVHPADPVPPPRVILPRVVTDPVPLPWCSQDPNMNNSSPTPCALSKSADGANP